MASTRQPSEQPYDIILAGKRGVGKNALFECMKDRVDIEPGGYTSKFDMFLHTLDCSGAAVKVRLWGTANMEKHGTDVMTRSYFRQKVGVILVYNTRDLDSLKQLQYWINTAKSVCTWPDLMFAAWGNESGQLTTESATLEPADVRQLIGMSGITIDENLYCTVNSETGGNVLDSYKKMVEAIHSKYSRNATASTNPTGSIQVGDLDKAKLGCPC